MKRTRIGRYSAPMITACAVSLLLVSTQPAFQPTALARTRALPVSAAPEPSALANRFLYDALTTRGAYKRLRYLTDRIGHRLSGTPQYDMAVKWALEEMKRDGIEHVHPENVMVPRWVRGEASAEILAPASHRLALLALGGSVATPPEGITAPVVVVQDLAELEKAGSKVKGAIVLFNLQIRRNGGKEEGYGAGSRIRFFGPVAAAKQGAVAMLIRSVGTAAYRLPHTGSTGYEDEVPKIPAAAVSAEDADLIARLSEDGERPTVRLRLTCQTLPDVEQANVVGELRGREKPDEIVVIGAHLDSWDVGQGAIDDGAGVTAVLDAMRMLKQLGFRPKRTIRAVLFANEENGLRGGRGYANAHQAEMPRHVAAIELDMGAGRPTGYDVDAGEGGAALFETLLSPFQGLGRLKVEATDGAGADISRMARFGVPLLSQRPDETLYFDWHHTEADTFDKVDADDLARNAGLLAFVAYQLAESDRTLPRQTPTERESRPDR